MKRYRFETVKDGDVSSLNRLLARGWCPVRESIVPGQRYASAEGDVPPVGNGLCALVLLERDDAPPTWQGELLSDGTPLAILEDTPLFRDLTEAEIREFVAAADVVSFAEGDVLFDVDQQEQSLFVLLRGEVSIHLVGLPLEDPVVLEVKPRTVFGESTFFAPAAHSAKAEAVTAVSALKLSRSQYDELRQTERPVALKIAENAARILAMRLQQTDIWVHEILEEGQNSQISQSWRRFRRRVGPTNDTQGGFIHV